MNRRRAGTTALAAVLLVGACSTSPGEQGEEAAAEVPDAAASSAPAGAPALDVEVLADGLDHPWDAAQAPDGTLLVDERGGGFTVVLPDGGTRALDADLDDLFAEGETGLMGLTLDPAFADTRRFFTCQGVRTGDGAEIQVVGWTVDAGWTAVTRDADPLVGTGDNAVGSHPQDLGTLAGKVLRVDPATGGPAAGNPFLDDDDPGTRLIWSYGHRNVQGVATQPGTGQVFTVEQGTGRDDEVNRSVAGANYGYDPDGPDGGYDESVPMTDLELPGAVAAVWSSGDPTIAASGGGFLDGPQWGAYDGLLLLGVQKDTGVLALRIDEDGTLVEQFRIPELEDSYGRVRTPLQGADGALYLTTDNGEGRDQLLRVTPRS